VIETVDGIASVVERLNERVRELERRVAELEGMATQARGAEMASAIPQEQAKQPTAATPVAGIRPVQQGQPPEPWKGAAAAETPAGVITVLGKAVLGIAGAYLLRAIAESGSAPKPKKAFTPPLCKVARTGGRSALDFRLSMLSMYGLMGARPLDSMVVSSMQAA